MDFRCLPSALADRLHAVELSARRAVAGARAGRHRANRHGESVEFAEHRPYEPGDPPSLIDWRAFARSDRYLVRRYEAEVSLTGYVLLDASQSMAWGSKLACATGLAAAAAFCLVRQADRAGLCVLGRELLAHHPPAGSLPALVPVLQALDALAPAGRGDIAAAMESAALLMPRRCLVLVVSDLLHPPEAIARGLMHLHHLGHDLRILHVVDPAELELPPGGLAELADLETGERVEADLDELRPSWSAAVTAHHEAVRRAVQAVPAGYRQVDTNEPIDHVLRSLA